MNGTRAITTAEERRRFDRASRLAWQELAEALAEVARGRAAGIVMAGTRTRLRFAVLRVKELGEIPPYEPELGDPEGLTAALAADAKRYADCSPCRSTARPSIHRARRSR